jgi:SAM-dependent methyltransferase
MSFKYGFISGKMLDYIYANKPSGSWGIGILLDKIFLSHPGWQVIRRRKENLEDQLEQAINKKLKVQKAVSIIDVASGPAQYIIDVLQKFKGAGISVLCRDFDERWVDEGKQKALAADLPNIKFEQADAFEPGDFKYLKENFDIAVSSGFYDWINDDELIKKSMRIIRDVLKPGGLFVFSNQSGHVDLKMVEEIFVDFNKNPLRMKVSPATLMNQWAMEAGFDVIRTVSDAYGHYSVSLAVRR